MEKKIEKIRTEYCLFDCDDIGTEDQLYDVILDSFLKEAEYYKNAFAKEKK